MYSLYILYHNKYYWHSNRTKWIIVPNKYQQEYEIDSNPELQRSEFAPVAKEEMFHEKVYKTLVTLGDFMCYVWFYDHDYDDKRTAKGSKRIHIVPSEERIEDSLEINKYFNIVNDVWSEGVIYVNAIFRRNGTAFTSNKDLKDCVKYFSGVAAHYKQIRIRL